MGAYPFTVPPETLALTLRAILKGQSILFVEHDENGGWHFFDGNSVFPGSELVLVPLGELAQRDPTLLAIQDLPQGWRAWRTGPMEPWERESSQLREKTRARAAALLEEMRRTSKPLPPGSPSTTDLIREARGE
jgi:hypothetical protein